MQYYLMTAIHIDNNLYVHQLKDFCFNSLVPAKSKKIMERGYDDDSVQFELYSADGTDFQATYKTKNWCYKRSDIFLNACLLLH